MEHSRPSIAILSIYKNFQNSEITKISVKQNVNFVATVNIFLWSIIETSDSMEL